MCATANVHSTAAIQDFRAALAHFMFRAQDAILSVELAARGAQEWLEHDQHDFWQRENRRRGEALVVAKTELARCKASKVFGHTPDCMDQKMAVRRAQAAVEEAEEKIGLVRNWTQELRHTIEEYKGRTQQFSNFLEGDLYQALALLDRVVASLESYASAAPPTAGNSSRAASHANATPSHSMPPPANEKAAADSKPAAGNAEDQAAPEGDVALPSVDNASNAGGRDE